MVTAESKVVVLRLNQQQLELVDRTIAMAEARDRSDLFLLALQEFHSETLS